jgi:hypothetical protein
MTASLPRAWSTNYLPNLDRLKPTNDRCARAVRAVREPRNHRNDRRDLNVYELMRRISALPPNSPFRLSHQEFALLRGTR